MKKDEMFRYTVKALIEILETFPQDAPVVVSGYENGFENIREPILKELIHEPQNAYWKGEFQPPEQGDTDSFQAVLLRRVERDQTRSSVKRFRRN
ncbi:MAG: hypothetical protein R6U51_04045 [Anaerolineales bacterium]